jgi:hypothetical protein
VILVDIAVGLVSSFAGSLGAIVFWFHFDMEARWQHRKVEHGRRLEERAR